MLACFGQAGDYYAIKNVSVIPMNKNTVLKNQTVLVKDKTIGDIGPSSSVVIPADYKIIDGENKFLIPGLFDMHTHFMYEQGISMQHASTEAGWMLANGVTTARIMNGCEGYRQIKKDIQQGITKGPELFVVSPQFMGNWPWKEDTITPKMVVTTREEVFAAVKKCKEEGYDAIKITQFVEPAVFKAIHEAARNEGITVTGHAGPKVKLPLALEMKQQIEHMDEFIERLLPDSLLAKGAICVSDMGIGNKNAWANVAFLEEQKIPGLVKSIKETGIYVTPTNYFLMTMFGKGQTVEEIRAMPGYQFIPEKLLEEKELRRKNYWEKKNIDAGLRAKWLRLRASLTKQLNDAGVPLMCGSDSPEWYLVQGFAVHDELQNLIECGLSNYDALKTATVNPATYLGILIRTGTIESGKEADMILLEGNPLDDIRNTRKIISVFSNGKMYDKKQIGELLKK